MAASAKQYLRVSDTGFEAVVETITPLDMSRVSELMANQMGKIYLSGLLPKTLIEVNPTNNQLVTATLLGGILLHTTFTAQADGTLVPCWENRDGAATMRPEKLWTPPAGCELYLVCFPNSPNGILCFLVFQDAANGNCFRAPMGNIYDDCRLCMGNNLPAFTDDIGGWLSTAKQIFDNAPWNRDLVNNRVEPSQKLFRFDGSWATKTPTADWQTLCARSSNIIWNDIMGKVREIRNRAAESARARAS